MSSYEPQIALPSVAIVLPILDSVIWVAQDGVIDRLDFEEARTRLITEHALFCHRKWTATRLGLEQNDLGGLNGLDALELFAFVRPARFCLPTAKGLGDALGLDTSGSDEAKALLIAESCLFLLKELAALPPEQRERIARLGTMMAQSGWEWSASVMAALGYAMPSQGSIDVRPAAIWHRLPDNKPEQGRDETKSPPLAPQEVTERLSDMLGKSAEVRGGQKAYSTSLLPAFLPPQEASSVVLAEAGTGTGKTLGYLAPATLWAERNNSAVWISTYTRNLQHQVVDELRRFYPDSEERDEKVVIRKGRENYLCLLNLDEALGAASGSPRLASALGLMARWAEASGDGDLTGMAFPAWLIDLLGYGATSGLADRRGECIHSACAHYSKCFVEKSRQSAEGADIVVANHALVIINAVQAVASLEEHMLPSRYIFDEGHHVFNAADGAFAVAFNGGETAELRRWIRGQEGGARSRVRGLRRQLEDILAPYGEEALGELNSVIEAAQFLPASDWRKRIFSNAPDGLIEKFLYQIRSVIYQHDPKSQSPYSLELALFPVHEKIASMAGEIATALHDLAQKLQQLEKRLNRILTDSGTSLDNQIRNRIERAIKGIARRAYGPVLAWCELLNDIHANNDNPDFVTWLELSRRNGEDTDTGITRHYLDPTIPFSKAVLASADGAVITSATLTDGGTDDGAWQMAASLTGASHLPSPPIRSTTPSPFDYKNQTRILVIEDLEQNEPIRTATAMSQLMQAAGGGGLGLFTAIRRLRQVHPHLAKNLSEAAIPLYAQHVDAMSLQTLLQIFREDRQSCLIGTDAVRDGIDVPGSALHLIIFDKVPWSRPDMLNKARAEYFASQLDTPPSEWADRAVRMRLRQAFGRLVRHGDDKGVFVMLDKRLPSRMHSAFPEEAEVRRCSLADAVATTGDFLKPLE